MKKMMLQTILLCCLCMASCSDIEENRPVLPPGQEQEEPETPDRPQDYTKLINKTNPVPAVYEQEAQQRGQVVRIDYDTRDYARAEEKTVFLTSHIIQDMERLIDDCIIMDYGRILTQQPVGTLLDSLRRYTCRVSGNHTPELPEEFCHPSVTRGVMEFCSFLTKEKVEQILAEKKVNYSELTSERMNLEDAFIGLTGKY